MDLPIANPRPSQTPLLSASSASAETGRPSSSCTESHIRLADFARPRGAGMLALAVQAASSAPYLAEALIFEETVEVVFEIW